MVIRTFNTSSEPRIEYGAGFGPELRKSSPYLRGSMRVSGYQHPPTADPPRRTTSADMMALVFDEGLDSE